MHREDTMPGFNAEASLERSRYYFGLPRATFELGEWISPADYVDESCVSQCIVGTP